MSVRCRTDTGQRMPTLNCVVLFVVGGGSVRYRTDRSRSVCIFSDDRMNHATFCVIAALVGRRLGRDLGWRRSCG